MSEVIFEKIIFFNFSGGKFQAGFGLAGGK
jgi:hypothetical protein